MTDYKDIFLNVLQDYLYKLLGNSETEKAFEENEKSYVEGSVFDGQKEDIKALYDVSNKFGLGKDSVISEKILRDGIGKTYIENADSTLKNIFSDKLFQIKNENSILNDIFKSEKGNITGDFEDIKYIKNKNVSFGNIFDGNKNDVFESLYNSVFNKNEESFVKSIYNSEERNNESIRNIFDGGNIFEKENVEKAYDESFLKNDIRNENISSDSKNVNVVLNNYVNSYGNDDSEKIINMIAERIMEFIENGGEGTHI